MIEAFATNGADHPLDIGSLPRRARCRQDFANAHVSHVFSEVIAKDRIAVAQEVARELGKGECLAQLLSGPICGRVGGHVEVQDATPVCIQNAGSVTWKHKTSTHSSYVPTETAGVAVGLESTALR